MNKREFNKLSKKGLDYLEHQVRLNNGYIDEKDNWHYAVKKAYCLAYILGENTVPFDTVMEWMDFKNRDSLSQNKIFAAYCTGFDYIMVDLIDTSFYIDNRVDDYGHEHPSWLARYADDVYTLVKLTQHASQLRAFYEDFIEFEENLRG